MGMMVENLKFEARKSNGYQKIRLSGGGYQDIRASGLEILSFSLFLMSWFSDMLHPDFLVP
jgi:hypothetical protein